MWASSKCLQLIPTSSLRRSGSLPRRGTRVHGFLLWLSRVWGLSSRPDPSLLPQTALSCTLSHIQWGVRSNSPILHMSKWRPHEAGET